MLQWISSGPPANLGADLAHAIVAQPPQVVRDQALTATRQLAQLTHATIAVCKLAQEPPPQRMTRQLKEPRRRSLAMRSRHHRHGYYINRI
jgi:hypothetical protein